MSGVKKKRPKRASLPLPPCEDTGRRYHLWGWGTQGASNLLYLNLVLIRILDLEKQISVFYKPPTLWYICYISSRTSEQNLKDDQISRDLSKTCVQCFLCSPTLNLQIEFPYQSILNPTHSGRISPGPTLRTANTLNLLSRFLHLTFQAITEFLQFLTFFLVLCLIFSFMFFLNINSLALAFISPVQLSFSNTLLCICLWSHVMVICVVVCASLDSVGCYV